MIKNAALSQAFRLFLLCVLICLAAGCAFSSDPKNIAAFKDPDGFLVSADEYRLIPPDEIMIQCSRVPEIHEQRQRVRPDGVISFEGLGELQVAGLTPTEVTKLVEEKVAGLYTLPGDAPLDVRIIAYQSKSYYVLGQVTAPGRKLYTGHDTVLGAIADAKPNPMAWVERVQVIRPSGKEDEKPKVYELNYYHMIIHGDLRKNVLLEDGDIVYIPPTPFAAVALTLEQVLRPVARAFSGAYYLQADPATSNGGRSVGGY